MKFTYPPNSQPLSGYTINRAIHRGGFGEVYYALSDGGKEVALKLLHQHTDVELRGARQCLNLSHPNLVTIFDIREDENGDHWVVMEYVDGPRLSDVLDRRGRLSVEETLAWLEGMAGGLTYLHNRGLVHRDLKPSNVFREGETVKVGDVGLSKFISESRRSAHTQSVGTVYYMAPEVAKGRYGREVDVYALGVMTYEMLTGDLPFDGESTGEILMKHLTDKPDLSGVPEHLRPVLAAALEKDPQKRTATVGDLVENFRAVADVSSPTPLRSAVRTTAIGPEASLNLSTDANAPREAALDIPEESFHGRKLAASRGTLLDMPAGLFGSVGGLILALGYSAQMPGPPMGKALLLGLGVVGGFLVSEGFARAIWRDYARSQPDHSQALEVGFWKAVTALWVMVIVAAFAFPQVLGIPRPLGMFVGIGAAVFFAFVKPHSRSKSLRRKSERFRQVRSQNRCRSGTGRKSAVQCRTYSPATPRVETPRSIPAVRRAKEMSGAFVISTFAAGFLAFVLAAFNFMPPEAAIAFGTTTALGSSLVVSTAKLREGAGQTRGRRWLIAGAGVLVGLFAFAMNDWLMVSPERIGEPDALLRNLHDVSPGLQMKDGIAPTAFAYASFFALLFGVRRWWRHVDSYRRYRFNISTVLVTAGVGWLLTLFVYFPHDLGPLWAAAIATIAQVAAPWTPPKDRQAA
ncbi:serine/threonine-protein kinase [Stratiformator vulcanicus]|nr:serine/threonine-protein kinase [Stratiformator vulcanicus]